MNKLTIFKKVSLALVGILSLGVLVSSAVAHAIPYNGDDTVASQSPAFNVFTGVPAPWGNESDFLRARVDDGSSTDYSDPLTNGCANGTKFQMRVYVHNGASAGGNNNGSGPSVAHGAKVKVSIPGNEASIFSPSASISATNAGTVNDVTTINCNGRKVKMTYIPGSATSYSKGTGVVQLSDSIVSSGTAIRSHGVSGDVWGCWDERVYVVLSVKVEAVPVVVPSSGECKLSDLKVFDNRKVRVSITGKTTNATVVGYSTDFGDGSTSNNQTAEHTYTKDGTYTIVSKVQVKFADGSMKWLDSASCVKKVEFKPGKPPVVIPPVTTLPNTGPSDMIGIFAAVSIAGALVHKFILSRRYQ